MTDPQVPALLTFIEADPALLSCTRVLALQVVSARTAGDEAGWQEARAKLQGALFTCVTLYEVRCGARVSVRDVKATTIALRRQADAAMVGWTAALALLFDELPRSPDGTLN